MKCFETFCYRSIPCDKHLTEIEGWEFGTFLYSKNETTIIRVKRKEDTCYNWVIKCMEVTDDIEITHIPLITNIIHSVEFPKDLPYYGTIRNISWYVMKYYPRICNTRTDQSDFHLIIKTCLEFIRDLHTKTGYLYMDWRLDNILKKQENGFVVADYEFLEKPAISTTTLIEDYIDNKDFIYYFLQRGANLDKPLYRYRFDLESIGSLAIEFLTEHDPPLWFIQCHKIRQKKLSIPLDTILTDRNLYKDEFLKTSPILQLYFQKIQECSWDTLDCMSTEWYDQLICIFEAIDAI